MTRQGCEIPGGPQGGAGKAAVAGRIIPMHDTAPSRQGRTRASAHISEPAILQPRLLDQQLDRLEQPGILVISPRNNAGLSERGEGWPQRLSGKTFVQMAEWARRRMWIAGLPRHDLPPQGLCSIFPYTLELGVRRFGKKSGTLQKHCRHNVGRI